MVHTGGNLEQEGTRGRNRGDRSEDAQQALLFLAPETSGDFGSLRSAVRSKPGVFVRASQDLNQASLDRTRSDRYLSEIKKTRISIPSRCTTAPCCWPDAGHQARGAML